MSSECPNWLKNHVKPKDSELKKPRKWNNTSYNWCSKATGGKCDGKWVAHLPKDCKGLSSKKRKAAALKLIKVNQVIVDAADTTDEGSGYESN